MCRRGKCVDRTITNLSRSVFWSMVLNFRLLATSALSASSMMSTIKYLASVGRCCCCCWFIIAITALWPFKSSTATPAAVRKLFNPALRPPSMLPVRSRPLMAPPSNGDLAETTVVGLLVTLLAGDRSKGCRSFPGDPPKRMMIGGLVGRVDEVCRDGVLGVCWECV